MRDRERFVDLRFGFAQRLGLFGRMETLGPLALGRDDLKSLGAISGDITERPLR